ncbi:hypothetical protein PMIN03_011569 [Paraphaeosphaeria minitans]
MCSREDQAPFSPTLSTLTPLFTVNRTLRTTLEAAITHLQTLATALSTPNTPAACEATCIEALAVAGAALASMQRYAAFYAPLFRAEDPVGMLRAAGVVFEGDPGVEEGVEVVVLGVGATRRTLDAMVRVVRWHEEEILGLEGYFRAGLRWIEGRGEGGDFALVEERRVVEGGGEGVGRGDGIGECGWEDELEE